MNTTLMSRVKEAAREHFKKVLPHLDTEYYFMPEKSHTIAAYIEGAQFLLTELSRAEEGHDEFGPGECLELAKSTFEADAECQCCNHNRANVIPYIDEASQGILSFQAVRALEVEKLQSQFDRAKLLMEGHMETMQRAEATIAELLAARAAHELEMQHAAEMLLKQAQTIEGHAVEVEERNKLNAEDAAIDQKVIAELKEELAVERERVRILTNLLRQYRATSPSKIPDALWEATEKALAETSPQ